MMHARQRRWRIEHLLLIVFGIASVALTGLYVVSEKDRSFSGKTTGFVATPQSSVKDAMSEGGEPSYRKELSAPLAVVRSNETSRPLASRVGKRRRKPAAESAAVDDVVVPASESAPSATPKALQIPKTEVGVEEPSATPMAASAPTSMAPLSIELPNLTKVNGDQKAIGPKDSVKVGVSAYLGFGINYFQYNQDFTDVSTSYKGVKGPSYNAGVGLNLSDGTAIEASYKLTPMYFNNSSLGLQETAQNWQSIVIQGSTRFGSLSRSSHATTSLEHSKGDREVYGLYGFQFHELPLELFDQNNIPTLRMIEMLDASLGAKLISYWSPNTRTSVLGRFQYPLMVATESDGSLSANPVLSFDGSLGLEKMLVPATWLGLHWYGQYQSYQFNYSDRLISAQGKQSAVFSTIELRLSYEY